MAFYRGVVVLLRRIGRHESELLDGDFYFLPDGAMATNTVIDGYRIGPDGKWIP